MAVINIRKDGTVVDDMSKVTVPKKKIEDMVLILQKKKEERGKKK